MARFLSSLFLFFSNARRGRQLALIVSRANGNLKLLDATLASIASSKTPVRLSVRHHLTTETYGIFLPCKIVKL